MRKVLIASVVVLTLSVCCPTVEACGDKFFMVGRGAKFGKAYAAVYPANILIFARPATSEKAAIRDPQFHKLLRQAGHAVSVIEDAALLDQALRSVAVDLVIADLTEAPRLDSLAASSPSHPKVVPVASRSDSAELKKLREQYMCKLKDSDRAVRFLDEIEDAMKARVSARRAPKS